ncbi:MAG TPA: hypothetical protein PLZ51_06995, partial [Aggregatilineales bacterium]|nr:hypothetical protein [Aggregatilineales bacterium]
LTNLEGAEAIKALKDESRIEKTAQKQVQVKLDKEEKAHQDEISTASRRDVLFDVGLYTVIGIVGAVVMLFLTVYQANQYKTNLEANRKLFETALAEEGTPRIVWKDDVNFYFEPKDALLIYETVPQPLPAKQPPKT